MESKYENSESGIVIIGGGIIGLATAYNLAITLKKASKSAKPQDPQPVPKITVIESSDRLCPGASTQATGCVGDSGSTNNVGLDGTVSLSYNMLFDMARKYNGADAFGWSEQVKATNACYFHPSTDDKLSGGVPPRAQGLQGHSKSSR
jgi:uncharacterized protein with NAD-binding domain and iron-sulfur cluster